LAFKEMLWQLLSRLPKKIYHDKKIKMFSKTIIINNLRHGGLLIWAAGSMGMPYLTPIISKQFPTEMQVTFLLNERTFNLGPMSYYIMLICVPFNKKHNI